MVLCSPTTSKGQRTSRTESKSLAPPPAGLANGSQDGNDNMKLRGSALVGASLLLGSWPAHGTVITNTRPEIAQMAGQWEVTSVQISSLITNQYPAFGTNTWEYIFPHN